MVVLAVVAASVDVIARLGEDSPESSSVFALDIDASLPGEAPRAAPSSALVAAMASGGQAGYAGLARAALAEP